jgi:hypothetical protein
LYAPIEKNIPIRLWSQFINQGANAICLGMWPYIHNDSIKQRNQFKKMFQLKVDSLKQLGLLKYAYLYGMDEIDIKSYKNLSEMIKLIREVDSDIRISCSTIKPNDDLFKMVDIYMPRLTNYKLNHLKESVKSKKETWWYVCANPEIKSAANFFIDYPAIAPRIVFWQGNKYDIKGFQYWSTVFWLNNTIIPNMHENWCKYYLYYNNPYEKDLEEGKRWPSIPWVSYSFQKNNGDGVLFYPGRKTDELWPSIRLINIRDGIEDYEYMVQLKNIDESMISSKLVLKKKKWLIGFNAFISDFKSYENNPSKLLRMKREAGLILQDYSNELKNKTRSF